MRYVRLKDTTLLSIHPEGEALSDAIAKTGDYWERDILDYIKENHPSHGTIVDVGANIGNHTVYFIENLDYDEIVAYEPVWSNFVLLKENIERLVGKDSEIVPIRKAVSNETGLAWLAPNPSNMGASELVAEGGTEYVEKTTLDSEYLENVTLIKIDVEWHEPQVLAGANDIIKRDHPLILIEDATGDRIPHILMGSYIIEKAWPEHKTYLYRSLNA